MVESWRQVMIKSRTRTDLVVLQLSLVVPSWYHIAQETLLVWLNFNEDGLHSAVESHEHLLAGYLSIQVGTGNVYAHDTAFHSSCLQCNNER